MSMFGLRAVPNVVAINDARKVPSSKSNSVNLTKLITGILGEKAEGPTEFEQEVQTSMETIAKEENGEYDKEDNCIIFGSEENAIELVVHAFIEENESDEPDASDQYVNYQAVVRTFDPNRFYAGDLATSFKEAVASVSKLLK